MITRARARTHYTRAYECTCIRRAHKPPDNLAPETHVTYTEGTTFPTTSYISVSHSILGIQSRFLRKPWVSHEAVATSGGGISSIFR